MAEIRKVILLKMTTFATLKLSIMSPELISYIGYGASFFVVLSFILKDLKKVRIVNLIGCILFVIYGVYNDMLWPIIIPNTILVFIQAYHLIKKD